VYFFREALQTPTYYTLGYFCYEGMAIFYTIEDEFEII